MKASLYTRIFEPALVRRILALLSEPISSKHSRIPEA